MEAVLFTRAWPTRVVHDAFDNWQVEKHLPDLLRAPGIVAAGYYRTVLDGLPQVYHGSGSCMASYVALTLENLLGWLRSSVLSEAIEDGSRWFSNFNELDGATYTGNVYEAQKSAGRGMPTGEAIVLAERFEVPGESMPTFESWLIDTHLPQIENEAGVLRAAAFNAIRDDIGIDYYLSPGNRMLLVELDAEAGLETFFTDGFQQAIGDSLRWDLRLPYVKRDVYRPLAYLEADGGRF